MSEDDLSEEDEDEAEAVVHEVKKKKLPTTGADVLEGKLNFN